MMESITAVKEGEPIYFICENANTHYRVEMVGNSLTIYCEDFAYGPCESSVEPLSRNCVVVRAIRHHHSETQPNGYVMDRNFIERPREIIQAEGD